MLGDPQKIADKKRYFDAGKAIGGQVIGGSKNKTIYCSGHESAEKETSSGIILRK